MRISPHVEVGDMNSGGITSSAHGLVKKVRILNARQSKFGCFTRRARRVKCDEGKPECARCDRSGRSCTGYPSNAPTVSSSSVGLSDASTPDNGEEQDLQNIAPTYALSCWKNITQERGRLIHLGCRVLARDPYGLRTALGKAFWSSLLPQLSHAITVVGAAVAAFGAAYEARILQKGDPMYEVAVTKHYSYALKHLCERVQTQPHGTLPLVVTCTLLAAMEAIRRRQSDALLHSQGAFKLLPTNYCKDLNETFGHSGIGTNLSDLLAGEGHFSLTLCRNLDLTISSYVLGRNPVLRSWTPSSMRARISSIEQANTLLAGILHSCFSFTSKAAGFKYRPRVELPFDLAVDQGHHISNLLFWLKNFQENVFETPEFAQKLVHAATRHASILKAQCLIALIHTSNIFMSHEAAYDNYISEFLQIIHCAEAALNQKELEISPLLPFAPTLGIIMPLCLTAVKCRHPIFRRRAISLLPFAGIEGPWNGLIEAAIATKIVQIEEERPADSGLEPSLLSMPSEISERNRVCRYAIFDESSGDNNLIHRITVEFSQCSEMDHMMISEVDHVGKSFWKTWRQDLEIS